MTQPQAREPGAIEIDPKHLLRARQQRIAVLTDENDMLVAFNNQLIEQIRELEEKLNSKESDGAEPPTAEGTPNPAAVGHEPRSNGRVGPSPADLARQRRAQGGFQ